METEAAEEMAQTIYYDDTKNIRDLTHQGIHTRGECKKNLQYILDQIKLKIDIISLMGAHYLKELICQMHLNIEGEMKHLNISIVVEAIPGVREMLHTKNEVREGNIEEKGHMVKEIQILGLDHSNRNIQTNIKWN